jgi:sigma-B regulation protein RsbU (phosphoserine phosphatase)
MPDGNFSQRTVELHKGERIVCYTDGITESNNSEQELFGEERLAEACIRYADVSLTTMVEQIFLELDAFLAGEPRHDDQALLAFEVTD